MKGRPRGSVQQWRANSRGIRHTQEMKKRAEFKLKPNKPDSTGVWEGQRGPH